MAKNPPEGTQRIIPYLLYKDGSAALDFLCRAFGFEERFRLPGPGTTIMHAETGFQDNVVMIGTPMDDHGNMKELRGQPGSKSLVVCYVDDVDAHYAKAKAAGAKILVEPEDQFYGDRTYRAVDPEGHEWYFHTHVRDVAPEDMHP